MKHICLVTLYPSHYREQIYHLMEKELGCSFIFGDCQSSIKKLDVRNFKNYIVVRNIPIGNGYFYKMPDAKTDLRKYDVIIDDMGVLCLSSWYNIIMAKFSGQKIYLWSHGWYGREGFMKKWIKRVYSALTDGMFVYGEYAKKLMIENGFEERKLHVIHNSLNYDKQLSIRNNLRGSRVFVAHFDNFNPVICFIGRLTPIKKLDLLLDALALLYQKGEKYNLVFIGDGGEVTRLKLKTDKLNLKEYVWFYGACYDEMIIAELIFNSDLCVAPGNIGLTAMHAMMYGCPCISHNDFPNQMPEFEAIKEDKTGSFFIRDNIYSLSQSISNWFRKNGDKREQVRLACYNEIDKNWNPHNQIELIKKVIGE